MPRQPSYAESAQQTEFYTSVYEKVSMAMSMGVFFLQEAEANRELEGMNALEYAQRWTADFPNLITRATSEGIRDTLDSYTKFIGTAIDAGHEDAVRGTRYQPRKATVTEEAAISMFKLAEDIWLGPYTSRGKAATLQT